MMKGMLKRALGVVAAAAMAVTGMAALTGTANAAAHDISVRPATITIKGDATRLANRSFSYVKLADYIVHQGADASEGATDVDSALTLATNPDLKQTIIIALQGTDYNAATDGDPMMWVAENLQDSQNSPYKGKLRDFVTKLSNLSDSAMSMPEDSDTAALDKYTATMDDPGLYLIFDATTGNSNEAVSKSIPMLVGTKVTGNSSYVPTSYCNGEVDLKNETTTIDKSIDPAPVNLGDTKTYTIKAEIPNWIGRTNGTFTITDTPSAGQSVKFNTIRVYRDANGNESLDTSADAPIDEWSLSGDGAFKNATKTTNDPIPANDSATFTVDLGTYMNGESATTGAAYNENYIGKSIFVTYEVVINDEALTNQVTNKAEVTNNDSTATDSTTSDDFFEPVSFQFKKVQGDGETPLGGAQFTVTRQAVSGQELTFKKAVNGDYVYDPKGETSVLQSDDATGMVYVKGLGVGTYVVEETQAPTGYFNMHVKFTVTVKDNGTVVYDDHTGDIVWDLVNTTEDGVTVMNVNTITQLPVTGAAGIAMFAVVAVLVAGAAVVMYGRSRKADTALRA